LASAARRVEQLARAFDNLRDSGDVMGVESLKIKFHAMAIKPAWLAITPQTRPYELKRHWWRNFNGFCMICCFARSIDMPNDHYVSQFYLRNFGIPRKPAFVWSYIRNGSPREKAIKSVASFDDLYTLTNAPPEIDPRALDGEFQKVETYTAPIIKQLITAKDANLPDTERKKLAVFMSLLANRTLFSSEKMKALGLHLGTQFIERMNRNDALFNAMVSKLSESEREEAIKSREIFKNPREHFTLEYEDEEAARKYFLGASLETMEGVAEIMLSKSWVILESDSSRGFVTSDNPIVLVAPDDYPPAMGLGFLQANVLFPLSPDRCLCMYNKALKRDLVKINREQVGIVNQHIIYSAYKYVYSNIASKDIQRTFDQTKEGDNTTNAWF
jgi:Protein of unknown function (DUF4238)